MWFFSIYVSYFSNFKDIATIERSVHFRKSKTCLYVKQWDSLEFGGPENKHKQTPRSYGICAPVNCVTAYKVFI